MRFIAINENTFSATEIADKFEGLTGRIVHPTVVGTLAKILNMDYEEVDIENPYGNWPLKQKRYGEGDFFLLVEHLKKRKAPFSLEATNG